MKRNLLFTLVFLPFILQAQEEYFISFDDSVYKSFITIDTINCHHNIWQIGAPHKTVFTSSFSAPNAIVTDTVNPIPPNDTSVFYFKTQAFFMGHPTPPGWGSFLGIFFYYEINKDPGTQLKIEVSSDTLYNWVNIDSCMSSLLILPYYLECPQNWYPDTLNMAWSYFSISNWGGSSYDTSDSVVFKFTMITDSVIGSFDGWMIDDIELMYYAEGIPKVSMKGSELSIAPNPAHNMIYISDNSSKSYHLSLINMLGSLLLEKDFTMQQTIDVSHLPDGIYEVVIQEEDGNRYYDKVVITH